MCVMLVSQVIGYILSKAADSVLLCAYFLMSSVLDLISGWPPYVEGGVESRQWKYRLAFFCVYFFIA